MKHLLSYFFPILCSTICLAEERLDPSRFEKQVVVQACNDPMQLEVLPDGRLLFIERNGTLKIADPSTNAVRVVGKREVGLGGEVGLLGLALDRDFATNKALYLFFSPKEKQGTLRLSRFVLKDEQLDVGSEKILFDYAIDGTFGKNHQGGGLFMAANGDLIIGTGDNTPPVPELQIDERPGFETGDAQRTSSNSMELRGKILRIHPTPEGGYTIPPDNLFPDGKYGRPEIFAMGVRNGFRQFVDPKTGFVYWGDVGQNVSKPKDVGPDGYDEINQARKAGNFGWPYFTGPNEAYHHYDYATQKVGALFDVTAPRNDSPNNAGLRELPPPQPALIWYPSLESKEFPMLGSGGRSAMAGPVFYSDPKVVNNLKLPDSLDHTSFAFDWMRNWIMAVKLDDQDKIAKVEPFIPEIRIRKPIEIKLAPDHTLYVIEFGDKWGGNSDSQIVRIVYQRGNRPPVALAKASNTAGKLPLKVRFDGGSSVDKDGDSLRYEWRFGTAGALGTSLETNPEFEFQTPGVHPVTLTVSDPHGARHSVSLEVRAGNAPPKVRIEQPENGSFYEPGQKIAYKISAEDEEDGVLPGDKIFLETKTALQVAEKEASSPGLNLMRKTTCFACHLTDAKSVGPAYVDVANKYRNDTNALEVLAQKVLSGGIGVWGNEIPMPPHPQHTIEETRLMVGWVLSLGQPTNAKPGFTGEIVAPELPKKGWRTPMLPVLKLTAYASDKGAAGVPPLRGESLLVLQPRRKKAANNDFSNAAEVVDVFEGGESNVLRIQAYGWFRFDTLNLSAVSRLTARVAPLVHGSTVLEVRLDTPEGTIFGKQVVECTEANDIGRFREFDLSLAAVSGLHDVVFLVRSSEKSSDPNQAPSPTVRRVLDVNWVEFHPAEVRRP
ncbi:MAG: PQQ-dependent sugar dehydrogenase [Verrucomicrobiota bacterium]